MRLCSVLDCERPHKAKGLCQPHYLRRRREGWNPSPKPCERCDQLIPSSKRSDARFCSSRCRDSSHYEQKKIYKLLYRYNLTRDELDSLSATCEICGVDQDLVIDHCHETGAVRGKLCRRCNAGIGMFGDDVARIHNAANYLTRRD